MRKKPQLILIVFALLTHSITAQDYSIGLKGGANYNNIGELPFTIQDYFKFTGGFKNMMRKGGSSFNVTSNDLGIIGLRNNQAANIETTFGASAVCAEHRLPVFANLLVVEFDCLGPWISMVIRFARV